MLHTLLYFLALISLSTSANWAKLNHMPVEILGFWRLGLAALILLTWIFIKKKRWPHLTEPNLRWVVLSGFFFFLHLATYKFAAKNTTISNTMILFASNPVWASLGAAVFFHEKITARVVFSYLLALLGIYILVHRQVEFAPESLRGDFSSLLSAFFYAAYMLTGKKARRHYENQIFSFFQYTVCAICFGLTCLYSGASFTGYDPVSWWAVAGLILLPTFLGHFSLTYLVHYMNINVMSCGKLLEPIFAAIIAYFLFRETLSVEAWWAFSLTALSVLILFAPTLLNRSQKIKNL